MLHALESQSGTEGLSQGPTNTTLLMRLWVKNHSCDYFRLSDTPLSHEVLNWFKVTPYVFLWLLGGQTWPCVSRGSVFKGSDGLALKSSYHPLPHRVICLKLGTRVTMQETISLLPACHPGPFSGHGHLVSSYTSVSCHFKPTSTGTVSTAVIDTISAPSPLWPSVSVLLNFSILVIIAASSVALKIYMVTKSLLSKQVGEKHIGNLIF